MDVYMKAKLPKACIPVRSDVIRDLYDSGNDIYGKLTVNQPHAEKSGLVQKRDALENVSVCTPLVQNKDDDSSESDEFINIFVSIEGTMATGVPNVYKKKVVEVLVNQIDIVENLADLRLNTRAMERFEYSIEAAFFQCCKIDLDRNFCNVVGSKSLWEMKTTYFHDLSLNS